MTGTPEAPGINYLLLQSIFDEIAKDTETNFEVKVSYVEIYNEIIRDLLVTNSKESYLDLREDSEKGVTIAGVTEYQVQEPK
jgi:kinesin family protein 18/19